MRIQVSFGIDPEELPAFNAFIAAASAARTARFDADDRDCGDRDIGPANDQASVKALVFDPAPLPVPASETVVFGEEDVASATLSLANKKGVGAASLVLKQFNVSRARDLGAGQRADYIAAAKAAEAAA